MSNLINLEPTPELLRMWAKRMLTGDPSADLGHDTCRKPAESGTIVLVWTLFLHSPGEGHLLILGGAFGPRLPLSTIIIWSLRIAWIVSPSNGTHLGEGHVRLLEILKSSHFPPQSARDNKHGNNHVRMGAQT